MVGGAYAINIIPNTQWVQYVYYVKVFYTISNGADWTYSPSYNILIHFEGLGSTEIF